jgi:hypothetical protein
MACASMLPPPQGREIYVLACASMYAAATPRQVPVERVQGCVQDPHSWQGLIEVHMQVLQMKMCVHT